MRGEEESGLERNGKDWNRRVEELGRTESCGEELEGSGMEWGRTELNLVHITAVSSSICFSIRLPALSLRYPVRLDERWHLEGASERRSV